LADTLGGQTQTWQTTVGQPIFLSDRDFKDVQRLSLERPDGRKNDLHSTGSTGDAQLTYGDTDVSGIYTLRGAGYPPTYLAVNVDTRESDLTPIDPKSFGPEIDFGGAGSNGDAAASGWQRAGWQSSFLWTAFALAMIELGLAWRFGRGSG